MSFLNEIESIWENIKLSMRENMPSSAVDLWLGELKIVSYENDCITFSTDTSTRFKVVKERFISPLEEKFGEYLGFNTKVDIIFVESEEQREYTNLIKKTLGEIVDSKSDEKPANIVPQNYNFEYTFENFIVGNSNKFAHAACTAVAAKPATDYNPLFIYGPSGIGKTHLMSAVVNEIKKKKPNLKVIFITCEDFTNELIESLSKREMPEFRNKYRNCDILLIDDIQFISGKDATQEEFFHTFNALYEDQKQIILASDRPPKDIEKLVDRLRTRFEWGIIADIQPPDLELRVAIIKKKAEQVSVNIPDDVLNFLAENLRSNIRQIEGAIKKLSALSFLQGKKISMELAKSCISELLGGAEPVSVTVEKIYSAVYKKYDIKKEDLLSQKRNKEIADARHIAIYLIREITEMSYPNIGKLFDRDHATIISSYSKIQRKITDPVFNVEIKELIHDVTGQ